MPAPVGWCESLLLGAVVAGLRPLTPERRERQGGANGDHAVFHLLRLAYSPAVMIYRDVREEAHEEVGALERAGAAR